MLVTLLPFASSPHAANSPGERRLAAQALREEMRRHGAQATRRGTITTTGPATDSLIPSEYLGSQSYEGGGGL